MADITPSYVEAGENITVPCPAAGATAGNWVKIGGIIGQAKNTTTSGLDLVLNCPPVGQHNRHTKATGFVPAAGDVAYYDFDTDFRLESAGTPIGFYAAAALTGDTAAIVRFDPQGAAAAIERATVVDQVHLTMVVNAIGSAGWRAPFAGTITALAYYTAAKPTSAGGAALLTIKNGAAGNTVLNAANVSLETATEDAITALTLTATGADLVMAAGGLLEILGTSDNADLVVGSGIDIFITFARA